MSYFLLATSTLCQIISFWQDRNPWETPLITIIVTMATSAAASSSSSSSSSWSTAKSKTYNPRFFWESRESTSGRFSPLLLEYGEKFLEDVSAFRVLSSTSSSSSSSSSSRSSSNSSYNMYNLVEDAMMRVKGRLKICSRSIIFEPSDVSLPMMRFPFKCLTSPAEPFVPELDNHQLSSFLASSSSSSSSSSAIGRVNGFLKFASSNYFEMKENNRIGPYKNVDCGSSGLTPFIFAIVHADTQATVSKLNLLRSECRNRTLAGPTSSRGDKIVTSGTNLNSIIIISSSSSSSTIDTKPTCNSMQPAAGAVAAPMFDSSQLVDFHEKLLLQEAVAATRVAPLVLHPGSVMVTDARVYFQPSNVNNVGNDSTLSFPIESVRRIYARRYLLRQRGLELHFQDGDSLYLVFDSQERRDHVVSVIAAVPGFPVTAADQERNIYEMLHQWQRGEVSNFDYLMFLNLEADRSLADLAQYPVFPHVLVDYSSTELDLRRPETFRDLSKPVGALDAQRLAFFRERYTAMASTFHTNARPRAAAASSVSPTSTSSSAASSSAGFSSSSGDGSSGSSGSGSGSDSGSVGSRYDGSVDGSEENLPLSPDPRTGCPPPFLYGTHYSTPGYVLYFLVRVAPEHMLCLSDGRFDAADRMFHSVAAMLDSCLHNPADVKELIPEFFCGRGEFLCNALQLDLGSRRGGGGEEEEIAQRLGRLRLGGTSGANAGDVELPPWAKGDSQEFVRLSRAALESDYVSSHLHLWIDLIFGYKQRGRAALEADNVFYYLTYGDDRASAEDDDEDSDENDHNECEKQEEEESCSVERRTARLREREQRQLEREARDVQVHEFGQCPKQLFAGPHPPRRPLPPPAAIGRDNAVSSASQAAAVDVEDDWGGGSPTYGHAPVVLTPAAMLSPLKVGSALRQRKGPNGKDRVGQKYDSFSASLSPTPVRSTQLSEVAEMTATGCVAPRGDDNVTALPPLLSEAEFSQDGPQPVLAGAIGLVELGDDFRAEVARELLKEKERTRLAFGQAVNPGGGGHGVSEDEELLLLGRLIVKINDSPTPAQPSTESPPSLAPKTPQRRASLLAAQAWSALSAVAEKVKSRTMDREQHRDRGRDSDRQNDGPAASPSPSPSPPGSANAFGSFRIPSVWSRKSVRNDAGGGSMDDKAAMKPTVVEAEAAEGSVAISDGCFERQLVEVASLATGGAVMDLSALDLGERLVICACSAEAEVQILELLTKELAQTSVSQVKKILRAREVVAKSKASSAGADFDGHGWRVISDNDDDDRGAAAADDWAENGIARLCRLTVTASFVAGNLPSPSSDPQSAGGNAVPPLGTRFGLAPLLSVGQNVLSRGMHMTADLYNSTVSFPSSPAPSLPSSVACHLSSDGGRALIVHVRGPVCHLFSHALVDGSLSHTNVILLHANEAIGTCAVGKGTLGCLASGAADGSVALWSLGLRPVAESDAAAMAPKSMFLPKAIHQRLQRPQKQPPQLQQQPLAFFEDVLGSSASAVATVPYRPQSPDSLGAGILVAVGAVDGTVAVFDSDKRGVEALLFCHQLRPTERRIVALEWLRVNQSGGGGGGSTSNSSSSSNSCSTSALEGDEMGSTLVLLSAAVDGTLHCIDCNGKVLAALDLLAALGTDTSSSATLSPLPDVAHGPGVELRKVAVSVVFRLPSGDLSGNVSSGAGQDRDRDRLVTSSRRCHASCHVFAGCSDGSLRMATAEFSWEDEDFVLAPKFTSVRLIAGAVANHTPATSSSHSAQRCEAMEDHHTGTAADGGDHAARDDKISSSAGARSFGISPAMALLGGRGAAAKTSVAATGERSATITALCWVQRQPSATTSGVPASADADKRNGSEHQASVRGQLVSASGGTVKIWNLLSAS